MFIVDHADRYVFAASSGYVGVFDEAPPFRVAGTWPAPAVNPADPSHSAQTQIVGISWNRRFDQLIITTDNQPSGSYGLPGPGLSVSAYDIRSGLSTGTPSQLWTTLVPDCLYGLDPVFYFDAAYESETEPYVFVPCQLPSVNSGRLGAERDGVVRLHLAAAGAGAACNAGVAVCPDGSEAVAPSPATTHDFLFDPGSDRGFSPANFNGSTDVLVYDGTRNAFVGRVDVGSGANTMVGVDTGTGRVYAVSSSGLTLIDGRLTPVPAGQRFLPRPGCDPNTGAFCPYATGASNVSIGVLPPDANNPFPRIPVVQQDNDGSWPHWDVYADTIPVSQQPNPANVDTNTHGGTLPTGTQLSVISNGSASGYGAHYDLVGGPASVANNLLFSQSVPQSVPFGYGDRDLLAGSVTQLAVDSGVAQGSTSALWHGDSATGNSYTQSTNGNQWPFPAATCSYPGGTAAQTYDGSYYGSDPNNPQQVPGSDASTAHATDNCNSNGGATAAAWYGGGPAAVSGFPEVSMGHSESSASITPGSATAETTSTVTSSTEGLHIVMPGGAGSVDIGRASATATATAAGTAGSATATYQSTISQVSMTVAGTTLSLCPGVCSNLSSVIAQINTAFPTFMEIIQPQPDPTYYHDKGGNPIASGQGYGSPGGYEALIQASLAEQDGDQKFNGMSHEESTILPALRVVTYSPQDGDPNQSRQIVDLAGVEVGADQGVEPISAGATLGVSTQQALCAAGGCNAAATSEYIAGTAGTPGTPGTPGTSGGGPLGALGRALGGAVERLFGGLQWLARNPLEALQMLGFLGLLGAPFLLMDRRRIWVRNILMRAR